MSAVVFQGVYKHTDDVEADRPKWFYAMLFAKRIRFMHKRHDELAVKSRGGTVYARYGDVIAHTVDDDLVILPSAPV